MPRWRVLAVGLASLGLVLWAGPALAIIISPSGRSFSAIEDQTLVETVATFESDTKAAEASFSATVNWGDGTSSGGTIVGTGPSGRSTLGFRVDGSHRYTSSGEFVVTVTITDSRDGQTVTVTGKATVTKPAQPPPPPPPPPPPTPPPPPDLQLTQSESPPRPLAGTRLTYTLTVLNAGQGPATGVMLRNTPPTGSTFVSAVLAEAPAGASCTGDAPVACTVGTLGPGQRAVLVHVVRLTLPGSARNLASVQADQNDPTPADNTSSALLAVGVPPPVLGRSVNARVVRGVVLVRLPGTGRFVPLTALRQLPVNTVVDTRRGRIELTSARDRRGGTTKGVFYAGLFTIRQQTLIGALTELRLTGGNFAVCRARTTASVTQRPRRTVRRLWGNSTGRFRTRGRFGSAAIRGTIWLTEDRCDGTLVRVLRGSVLVIDLPRGRRVIVRAGRSYLARAPG